MAVLPAAESQRLAEYILGPQHPKILKGRTRGEERRRLAVALLGLISVVDELKIVLCVEKEVILEDAFMVGREALLEMRSGKVKGLPPLRQRRPSLRRHPSGKHLNTRKRWSSMGC